MAERLVRDLVIEEALREEIKHTLEHNNQSYVDWCSLLDKEGEKNNTKLTITYGTGWQKISSGRIYDSSRGHAFIIGARSKGITGMVLYSKACQKFDAAEKRIAEASILFELPSKLFGHSFSSAYYPLFSAEAHFWQVLE